MTVKTPMWRPECYPIILGAFGEIIKFINSSNGQKLPFYISALTSLSRYFPISHSLPENSSRPKSMEDLRRISEKSKILERPEKEVETEHQKIIRKLLESCGNMVGSNFSNFVTLAMFDVIANFISHLSRDEILPFSAKLFPVLLRRFDDSV
mgnify:CR=1 FL=1